MNFTYIIAFYFTILFSSLHSDVVTSLENVLPNGITLTEQEVVFSRNFMHHELHSLLCHKAKEAKNEGEEKIQQWASVFDLFDGFSYRIFDEIENSYCEGKLDLTRPKELLLGKERNLKLSITKLNYAVDGLQEKASEISHLFASGFGKELSVFEIHLMAWLDNPTIFLAYDEAHNHELVGCLWAMPYPDTVIQTNNGIKKTTVWRIYAVCCRAELTGTGIAQTLFSTLNQDPAIQYSILQVYHDNTRAKNFYFLQGYQLGDLPPIELYGMSEDPCLCLYRDYKKNKSRSFKILH